MESVRLPLSELSNLCFVLCFVFFSFREKGSDASWKNDQEPPSEVTIECFFFLIVFDYTSHMWKKICAEKVISKHIFLWRRDLNVHLQ